jgi:hypothetical protein
MSPRIDPSRGLRERGGVKSGAHAAHLSDPVEKRTWAAVWISMLPINVYCGRCASDWRPAPCDDRDAVINCGPYAPARREEAGHQRCAGPYCCEPDPWPGEGIQVDGQPLQSGNRLGLGTSRAGARGASGERLDLLIEQGTDVCVFQYFINPPNNVSRNERLRNELSMFDF